MKLVSVLLLVSLLVGCATAPGSKLTYSPEVSRQSETDPGLFNDLVFSNDGVGGVDKRLYPKATTREIVKIRVRWGGGAMGMEEWTINHGTEGNAVYIVSYYPTQGGGINYSITVKGG